MNKIFRNSLMLAAVVFGFSACTDEYEYDGAGEWNAAENYQEISFVKTSESVTLEESTYSFAVSRENTEGAISVPFKVEVNTDEVFTVGEAKFADGEKTALCTVDFSKAEVGKSYTLSLLIDDPRYSSYYSPNNAYSLTVKYLPTISVGKATWALSAWQKGVLTCDLRMRTDKPNAYVLRGWGANFFTLNGVDVNINFNKETGELSVPENFTGYVYSSYGEVYLSDLNTYTGTANYPNSWDATTGVATVYMIYYVGAGYFGNGPEALLLEFNQ